MSPLHLKLCMLEVVPKKNEKSRGTSRSKSKGRKRKLKCWYCNKTGHLKKDCWKRNRTIKCLRTDNGGEFTSLEFEKYCKDEGIVRHKTNVYTP